MPFGPWPGGGGGGGGGGNNAWLALFAERALQFANNAGIAPFDVDDSWEFADAFARTSTLVGAGGTVKTAAQTGAVIDLAAGAVPTFALACPKFDPGLAANSPAVWIANPKTDDWYVECLSSFTGNPAGACRAALAGAWTGGAAVNSGSLVQLGLSPTDFGHGAFARYVLSVWDTNGAAWREVESDQDITDRANKHAFGIGCVGGQNLFGYYDGNQIASASINAFGITPSSLCAFTVGAFNQDVHAFTDVVYAATRRGQV